MSEWLCEIILIGEWVGALLLPVRAAMKGEIKGVRWRDGQEWMMGPSSSSPPSSISACCCCFGSTSAGGSSQGEVIWARRPAASDLSSKFDPLRGLHNTWEMTESPPSCSKSWMMSAEEQRAERARRRSAWTGRNRGCRKALMRGPSAGRAASAPRDMSELAAKRAAETQFPFCNAAVKTWMTPWKLYRLNYYYYYGRIHACFLNKFILPTWISLPTKVSTMETKTWPSLAVTCLARLQLTGTEGMGCPPLTSESIGRTPGWWCCCGLKVTSWTSWEQVCLKELMRSSLSEGSVCKAACSASRMNWITWAKKSGIKDESLDSSKSSINL